MAPRLLHISDSQSASHLNDPIFDIVCFRYPALGHFAKGTIYGLTLDSGAIVRHSQCQSIIININ